jgi:hypothetical protein
MFMLYSSKPASKIHNNFMLSGSKTAFLNTKQFMLSGKKKNAFQNSNQFHAI